MFINRNSHKPYEESKKSNNTGKFTLMYWSFISVFASYLLIHSLITKHHPSILLDSLCLFFDLLMTINSYFKYKESKKTKFNTIVN